MPYYVASFVIPFFPTQDFALIIYQMPNLEEVGLTSLTHILRGGVRIEKNYRLCYVNTINWKEILSDAYHENIHIHVSKFMTCVFRGFLKPYYSFQDNEDENKCPDICPKSCKRSKSGNFPYCWNEESCQTGEDFDWK